MSTAMEHNSVIPLYAQIVEYLRKDIAANVFGRNGRIPTEAELSEKYGVSRITVRRAVDELVSQGLVEKKQGKGTFVTAPRFSRRLDSGPLSFSEMCEANGLVPGAKILETGWDRGPEVTVGGTAASPYGGGIRGIHLQTPDRQRQAAGL